MKFYVEKDLRDFDFWGGAKQTRDYLTNEEVDAIEWALEDSGEKFTETEINDIFWFDADWIAEILGYEDFEEIMRRVK